MRSDDLERGSNDTHEILMIGFIAGSIILCLIIVIFAILRKYFLIFHTKINQNEELHEMVQQTKIKSLPSISNTKSHSRLPPKISIKKLESIDISVPKSGTITPGLSSQDVSGIVSSPDEGPILSGPNIYNEGYGTKNGMIMDPEEGTSSSHSQSILAGKRTLGTDGGFIVEDKDSTDDNDGEDDRKSDSDAMYKEDDHDEEEIIGHHHTKTAGHGTDFGHVLRHHRNTTKGSALGSDEALIDANTVYNIEDENSGIIGSV